MDNLILHKEFRGEDEVIHLKNVLEGKLIKLKELHPIDYTLELIKVDNINKLTIDIYDLSTTS